MNYAIPFSRPRFTAQRFSVNAVLRRRQRSQIDIALAVVNGFG